MLVIAAYLENTFFFMFAIFTIAMGTGGIKPCISIFGGDQVRHENFFSIFYFSINCGAMISMLTLPFLSEKSYIMAFSIPFLLVSLAIILFISGTRLYTIKKPDPALKEEFLDLLRLRNAKKTNDNLESNIIRIPQADQNNLYRSEESHDYSDQISLDHYNIDYRTEQANQIDIDRNDILEIEQGEFQRNQYFNEYVGDEQFSPFDLIKSERLEEHNSSFIQDCHPDPEYLKNSEQRTLDYKLKMQNFLSIHEQNEDLTIQFGEVRNKNDSNTDKSNLNGGTTIQFYEKNTIGVSNPSNLEENTGMAYQTSDQKKKNQQMRQYSGHRKPSSISRQNKPGVQKFHFKNQRNHENMYNDYDEMIVFSDQPSKVVFENNFSGFGQKRTVFENSLPMGATPSPSGPCSKAPAYKPSQNKNVPIQSPSAIEPVYKNEINHEENDSPHYEAMKQAQSLSAEFRSDQSVSKKSAQSHVDSKFESESAPKPVQATDTAEQNKPKHMSLTIESQKIIKNDRSSGKIKEDINAICDIIKIFLPITFFWAIYDQQATSWTDQARRLDQRIFDFRIIPSQMLVLNAFFTLIFIPLFSRVKLTAQRKMVYGFYLGAFSFFASALVEHFRTRETSILVQIPQYILLTSGEVFLSVTGLEFSYNMAPYRFRSLVLAIWLFMASVGNVFVAIVSRLELFTAPIGEYVFYGVLAFLSARILDYQFTKLKYNK